MKFHQLPIGAGFRWRGETYRKVSPLKAAEDGSDTQRLVPRSAPVSPVDASDEPVEHRLPDVLDRADLEAALAQCGAALARALDLSEPPLTGEQRAALQQAHARALADLIARLAKRG